jgi:hypothetical protein
MLTIQLIFHIQICIMSDLAPFVAAAIRDKIVHEQKEEITSLHAEIERLRAILAQDAIRGKTVFRIAVTGPFHDSLRETPIVYAVSHMWSGEDDVPHERFQTLNVCKLRDIVSARLFVNGLSCNLNELRCILEAYIGEAADYTSLEALFDGGDCWFQFYLDHFSDLEDFNDRVDWICFKLANVPKKKWFEFAGLDSHDVLAKQDMINLFRSVSFDEIMECFGGGALVIFDHIRPNDPYILHNQSMEEE